MSQTFIESGITCGIEFECDNLTSEQVSRGFRGNNWRVTHDASIETDTRYVSNLFVEIPGKNTNILSSQRITIGTEIVSPILNSDSEEFYRVIENLVNFLQNEGETEQSDRSGIHFHISLPSPRLTVIKNIIRLGLHYESLFFKLGGMGYNQRGEKNDSIYARPYSQWGAPCVPLSNGRMGQCFELETILKCREQETFWQYFGDMPYQDQRYTPIRYQWLNIYPLYPGHEHKGTVEFRIFNKTLNPDFIYCTFMACRNFIDLANKYGYDALKEMELLDQNSVFEDCDNIFLLDEFSTISNLDSKTVKILRQIIDRTPNVNIEKGYVSTHLMRRLGHRFWDNTSYSPKSIPPSEIRTPKFVDIHTLRGE